MSVLGITKTTVSTGLAVFQNVEWNAQGGFTLDTTGLTIGALLPAGTPMGFDEATRLARPVLAATLTADATNSAVTYQVKKGHGLAVGQFIARSVGGVAHTITAIDTSNAAYDVITVDTTLGVAISSGQSVFQSSAAGTTAGAFIVTPKGLLYEDEIVAAGLTLSVVMDGVVYARRIPGYIAALEAALPNIIFSQSY